VTKGGVRFFGKAVAMECAAAGDGIRLKVSSRRHQHADLDEAPVSAGSNAPTDPYEVAKARVPLGRAGEARDIAKGGAVPRL
jgi:hypothetical protein